VTGYTALYWAWARANLEAARLYLPWARDSGMLAIAGAAVALGILFSSKTFPAPPKIRLLLSLLATVTIGFFAEFRNDGLPGNATYRDLTEKGYYRAVSRRRLRRWLTCSFRQWSNWNQFSELETLRLARRQ